MRPSDRPDVMRIIHTLDLGYPSFRFDEFRVATEDGRVMGIVDLQDLGPAKFLNTLAVDPADQGKGIARKIIESILAHESKPVFLYTQIPLFFQKFQFEVVTPPPFLPPRSRFMCDGCVADVTCFCMVWIPA